MVNVSPKFVSSLDLLAHPILDLVPFVYKLGSTAASLLFCGVESKHVFFASNSNYLILSVSGRCEQHIKSFYLLHLEDFLTLAIFSNIH